MTSMTVVMDERDVVAVLKLLTIRSEPPTREGIQSAIERAEQDSTLLGRRTRSIPLRQEQLDWLRGTINDYLRNSDPASSDRETFSRVFARLWADDLLPRSDKLALFFERAKLYSTDPDVVGQAKEFLRFKLEAAARAREEILGVLNRGVTTYQAARDPKTGELLGLTKETQSFVELFHLRLWLDLLLFELIGVEDALLQAANVGFNLGAPQGDTRLYETVSAALRQELERGEMPTTVREITGLDAWRDPSCPGATRLGDLRELRKQATHRHLVKMREAKPWSGGALPAPVEPAKLRSEFYVDLGNGREEALDRFVGLTVDHVAQLVTASCSRLADLLWMLTDYHGGPLAAARRRAWRRSAAPGTACPHGTVEPRLDWDGVELDPYFCSQCGIRVEDPAGKQSPEGFTFF